MQGHAPDEAGGSDRDRNQPDQIPGTLDGPSPIHSEVQAAKWPRACAISDGARNKPHPPGSTRSFRRLLIGILSCVRGFDLREAA